MGSLAVWELLIPAVAAKAEKLGTFVEFDAVLIFDYNLVRINESCMNV